MQVTTRLVLMMASVLFVKNALAQDSSSSSSSASASSAGNSGSSTSHLPDALKDTKFDPNTEITDPRLRAEAGSLSRYSVKANINYSGPTVNDFSNQNQPNPDHTVGAHKVNMRGSIATRLRIDRDRAISFGTGISALTPFATLSRFDVSNPYLSYDVTRKIHGFQTRISPGIKITTTPEDRDAGQVGTTSMQEGVVYNIGMSRWSVNLDADQSYNYYSRSYRPGTPAPGNTVASTGPGAGGANAGGPGNGGHRGGRGGGGATPPPTGVIDAPAAFGGGPRMIGGDGNAFQYNFSFRPGLKYLINDSFNIATSVNIGYFNPRSSDDQVAIEHLTVGESFGVGWAVKRDIYLYPFVTFYPTSMSLNTTSFNFATIISVL